MFQGIFKSALNDANKNYIFGTGSIPIQIKVANLETFAKAENKQQGYQVAEVNKLISTMLTGWGADGSKPKSMSDNYLELILSCDNGFVVKKRLQFPHIIAWQNDSTPYNIADVYKEFSIDNWLKADDFENPDITLVVEPTDEILTTSTATPPEATTEQSGRFYLYYRNLPVGVNRIHIDFHIKTKTEPIDFDLEVIDGMSWKNAQTILASDEQAKINVLLSGVKDVYKFTGAEGNFGEITMHEWSELYQQIISLKPNNKFTHDLYFYVYDESELNTKITELEAKVTELSVAYVLSADSYISGNSIHIGTLHRLTPGTESRSYTINNTFSGSTGAILVFNKTSETVSIKPQAQVLLDDDILLWCGRDSYGVSQHFNYTGLLGPASLYDSLSKSIVLPTQKTIVCSMIAEALWSQNGNVYGPCDGAQKSTFCTPRFLKIDASSESIVSILCENTEDFFIFQFDKDFGFLQRNQNSLTLNPNTRYVKILVRLQSRVAYTYSKRKLEIVAKLKGEPEWVYNIAESGDNGNYMFRTYEIEMPIIPDTTATPTENYQGVATRVMNRGFICLPVNYSPFGKPSKVAIYCNGTSGYNFDSNSLPYNNSLVKFLAKCGFAVIGCSTRSEVYKDTTQQAGADGDLSHPLSFSCYENLWKYMCEEFNLDNSGAYIFGISSGGLMTILLSQLKTIPIKAAASLAGSVDIFSNMRICDGGHNRFWLEMLGMSYPTLPTGLSSAGRMQVVDADVKSFMLQNIKNFSGVNPFWMNGDLPVASFIDKYFDTINYTSQLESNADLVSIVDSARVSFSIPLKIWHAIDDVNVPIAMSRFFQKMVQNGGGMCYLREFPADCGGHHAVGVDTDSGYPVMNYETPFGETIEVAVAWGELVDWFERW